MKIMQFDKSNLDALRASLNEALADVAAKHGLSSMKALRINYSTTTATIAVEACTGDAAEDPIKRMEARSFGFKPSVYGAVITSHGREFTVRGFARTKLKVDGDDGRSYKFDLNAARPQLQEHLING